MNEEKMFTLHFTNAQLQLVLNGLGQLPYYQSAEMIQYIVNAISAREPEPEPEVAQ